MPKGIYQRNAEMLTGKYKRTKKHLELLKLHMLKYRINSYGFKKGHLAFKNSFGHVPWNKWKKTGERPQCVKDKISKAHKGKHHSIEHIQKMTGENNPNWKGGISNDPYSLIFNDKLKEKIRKRDNYECQVCYITEEETIIVLGEVLSVHHIDYDKDNCDEYNLVSLCKCCHGKTNSNRYYWKEYFKLWKSKLLIMK